MGLQKLLHSLTTDDVVPAGPAIAGGSPTKKELYQNRLQYGPNFGALFVQERWIDDSLFTDKSQGGSELAALEGQRASGTSLDDMAKKWEEHWDKFISNDDWKKLSDSGVTAIRLPIGVWSLGHRRFVKGLPFEKYHKVYENSWKAVRKIIDKAGEQSIGVLVDFHGLPGGANGDEHSGSDSGKAELWHSSKYRDQALDAYEFVASELRNIENVVGIQLVNEAPWGQSKLKPFYLEAIQKIRKIDPVVPLVISDGWDLSAWRDTVKKLEEGLDHGTMGVVIDTHIYRMFSDEDRNKSADEHIQNAPNCVSPDDDTDVMVGEWSCVLDEGSWNRCSQPREQAEIDYGQRQLSCFEKCARAGAYFWTYKFGQGAGGAWDFRVMSEKGALSPPKGKPNGDKDEKLHSALEGHKNYWNSQDGSQDWEHWRFEDGFSQGWNDASSFAEFNESRVGRIAALKSARTTQHAEKRGASDKLWVFGHAYTQGIKAFYGD